MRKTAIVVPCYNEERRLKTDEFIRFAGKNHEISFIFVNDGSADDTGRILSQLSEKDPARFAYIDLPRNSGKAEAVRQGFLEALGQGYQYIGFWDADLATPLDCIIDFVSIMDSGKDVVLGSRVRLLGRDIERRALRHYLGRVFATVVSILLGLPVYDTQCGAKLFRRTRSLEAAMGSPFSVKWTFDVELLGRLLILDDMAGRPAAHKAWVEFPLPAWEEVRGSKVGPSDFMRSGTELLRLISFFHSGASRRKYVERLRGFKNAGALKGAR